ncbi:MAG: S1 RNA-binding domain-containing protein, partial [Desulfovibrionales bacterium]|nr:S1 RNA-binding domain-containing protein [Desulfovibrionales bacterium]
QDGLVHISQLSDSFVKDPHALVRVKQRVRVRVLEVDIKRRRISLSMKSEH